MKSPNSLCSLVVAGLATASGAQVMTISWVVDDTGDHDGIIEPGESAELTMWAGWEPAEHGYAGSAFDITGVLNWDTGTVDAYTNLVDSLGNGPGTLGAGNDITVIESFQLPEDFNPDYDPSNPIAIYAITWTPTDYAARTVSLTSVHEYFSVYTTSSGSNVFYTGDVSGGSFDVVPTPGSAGLLGAGGLLVLCRRRAVS